VIEAEAIETTVEFCNLGIWQDAEVLSYCRERGLSDLTIREWRLGAFPEDPNQLYTLNTRINNSRYITPSVLRLSEGYFESNFLKNRLIIPVADSYGTPVAIMGRTTLSQELCKQHDFPKYYNTHYPKTRSLFGLNHAIPTVLRTGEIILVEGNLDVITAHQYGLRNVAAISSSNISMHQISLAARYAERIFLALDGDEAGQIGIQRALEKHASSAKQLGVELVPMYFKDGKDLDEALRAGGIKW
jgi:DNA primase